MSPISATCGAAIKRVASAIGDSLTQKMRPCAFASVAMFAAYVPARRALRQDTGTGHRAAFTQDQRQDVAWHRFPRKCNTDLSCSLGYGVRHDTINADGCQSCCHAGKDAELGVPLLGTVGRGPRPGVIGLVHTRPFVTAPPTASRYGQPVSHPRPMIVVAGRV